MLLAPRALGVWEPPPSSLFHDPLVLGCEEPAFGKASVCEKDRSDTETDETILQRRQKQIDYGKNTVGYQHFLQQVPNQELVSLSGMMETNSLCGFSEDWPGALRTLENLPGDTLGRQFAGLSSPGCSSPWLPQVHSNLLPFLGNAHTCPYCSWMGL